MQPIIDGTTDHIALTLDGRLEPTVDPAWDEIERGIIGDAISEADVRDNERENALRFFVKLKAWDFQNGMKDPHGLMIRSAVSSWAVLPLLRPLTLTRLALGLRLQKQSLGRWVDDFKRTFPNIRNCHMRDQ